MRPMILTMSAFGSYADCVTIDFGQVQQGVFLITGDTGADRSGGCFEARNMSGRANGETKTASGR